LYLEEITERFQDRASGVLLDAYYCCTHKPCQGCECRKPRPGLLHKTASDLNIDLARSIFIGDFDTDIQPALSAGCQPLLFDPGFRYLAQ
jgi:histidinol-phosphate phosphatase family protein